jgi:hypothetical protein
MATHALEVFRESGSKRRRSTNDSRGNNNLPPQSPREISTMKNLERTQML